MHRSKTPPRIAFVDRMNYVNVNDAYFYLALVVKPGLTSQKVFFRGRVFVVVFFETNAQNQKV